MKKLLSAAMAIAFAISLATVAMAAPKKVVRKVKKREVRVRRIIKAEVIKVEKFKKGILLQVKVDGKILKYHVTKAVAKTVKALKKGEKIGLTLRGRWVHGIKTKLAKSTPEKSVPTKTAPTKTAPTKSAPTKTAPTKSAPTKTAPTKSAPTKTAPAK